jgi:hypothetical protein
LIHAAYTTKTVDWHQRYVLDTCASSVPDVTNSAFGTVLAPVAHRTARP